MNVWLVWRFNRVGWANELICVFDSEAKAIECAAVNDKVSLYDEPGRVEERAVQ